MTQELDDLPNEIVRQLLAFWTQYKDGSESMDTMDFVRFVLDNVDPVSGAVAAHQSERRGRDQARSGNGAAGSRNESR